MTTTRRILAIAAVTAVAVSLAHSPSSADPVLNGEFAVDGLGANNQITPGPDGYMWVTLESATNDVARITPAGAVTQYDFPGVTNPIGITAGPDGRMWVTQAGGVASFDPANPVNATAHLVAAIGQPQAIVTGPDGNLWTASDDKVIRIPPASPATATSIAGTGLVSARWITSGSDGNLWVADFGGEAVVRVTTAGVGTKFPAGGSTQGVAAGPNGQVAFTQQGTAPYTIGRITTTVETTPVPGSDPFGITFGPDGAYWAAQFATNSLARVTTTGTLSTLALPANSGPRRLAAGPGNTLWVTLETTDRVARVSGVDPAPTPTPSPTLTPTPTPTPSPPLQTTITKKPKKTVRKAKVRFRFTGTDGASFRCKLDKRRWVPCTSPKTYRVKPGKHVFKVRAALNGQVDSSPAKWKFRRR